MVLLLVADRVELGSFEETVMEFVAAALVLPFPVHRLEPRGQSSSLLPDPDLAGFR